MLDQRPNNTLSNCVTSTEQNSKYNSWPRCEKLILHLKVHPVKNELNSKLVFGNLSKLIWNSRIAYLKSFCYTSHWRSRTMQASECWKVKSHSTHLVKCKGSVNLLVSDILNCANFPPTLMTRYDHRGMYPHFILTQRPKKYSTQMLKKSTILGTTKLMQLRSTPL